jgi:hypothetical protein
MEKWRGNFRFGFGFRIVGVEVVWKERGTGPDWTETSQRKWRHLRPSQVNLSRFLGDEHQKKNENERKPNGNAYDALAEVSIQSSGCRQETWYFQLGYQLAA